MREPEPNVTPEPTNHRIGALKAWSFDRYYLAMHWDLRRVMWEIGVILAIGTVIVAIFRSNGISGIVRGIVILGSGAFLALFFREEIRRRDHPRW